MMQGTVTKVVAGVVSWSGLNWKRVSVTTGRPCKRCLGPIASESFAYKPMGSGPEISSRDDRLCEGCAKGESENG